MTAPRHRLPRWQRQWLYVSGALLLASGALWLALEYSVGPGAGGLPQPLQAWTMRLHGLAAFAALFLLGALAAGHVPQGWRLTGRQRWVGQRRLGLTLCALGAALALSGWQLYYAAPEWLRPTLGWTHAAIGAAAALALAMHRRRR
jgi:hypothetical protein